MNRFKILILFVQKSKQYHWALDFAKFMLNESNAMIYSKIWANESFPIIGWHKIVVLNLSRDKFVLDSMINNFSYSFCKYHS